MEKSCVNNRLKVFERISSLIDEMNGKVLLFQGIKFEKREEYAIEYIEKMLADYLKVTGLNPASFVYGSGHRKSMFQKQYQEMEGYLKRLKDYARHIEICGDERNSYCKTDHDATFMRVKCDYMGNDQLLPAYNMQVVTCDEYIAVVDAKPYASDMDCFAPLMEKFRDTYGHFPKYPVADAGYGSYNNYIYCEEHGMEKYMKFTMFEKETKNQRYREDPFRAVNYKRNDLNELVCPNGQRFIFKYSRHVKGNKYGRTEEIYECENCEGCPCRKECLRKQAWLLFTKNGEK